MKLMKKVFKWRSLLVNIPVTREHVNIAKCLNTLKDIFSILIHMLLLLPQTLTNLKTNVSVRSSW